MRTIKFRGKRADNGEWVCGYYANFMHIEEDAAGHYAHTIITGHEDEMHEVNPASVGQFTGLTDKNGKEIYEGDIVRLGDKKQTAGVIEYGEDEPAFQLNVLGRNSVYDIYRRCANRYEVIDNIHDNPELTKK